MRPERIVFQHVSGPPFQLTATFAEHHRRTRLTMRMLFETADECSRGKRFALEANEQNLGRLEAELAGMA